MYIWHTPIESSVYFGRKGSFILCSTIRTGVVLGAGEKQVVTAPSLTLAFKNRHPHKTQGIIIVTMKMEVASSQENVLYERKTCCHSYIPWHWRSILCLLMGAGHSAWPHKATTRWPHAALGASRITIIKNIMILSHRKIVTEAHAGAYARPSPYHSLPHIQASKVFAVVGRILQASTTFTGPWHTQISPPHIQRPLTHTDSPPKGLQHPLPSLTPCQLWVPILAGKTLHYLGYDTTSTQPSSTFTEL